MVDGPRSPERPQQPAKKEILTRRREFAGFSVKKDTHLENEDQVHVSPNSIIVTDGAGGEKDGAIASRIALGALQDAISTVTPKSSVDEIKDALTGGWKKANAKIRHDHPGNTMKSTASVVYIRDDGLGVALSGGDSAITRYTKYEEHNQTVQVSPLDNHIQDLADRGIIKKNQVRPLNKKLAAAQTEEDIKELNTPLLQIWTHRHVVTNTISGKDERHESIPHVGTFQLQPGDVILIRTDGVDDNMTDHELEKLVRRPHVPLVEIIHDIVNQSNTAAYDVTNKRQKPDDITAAAIRWGDEGEIVSGKEAYLPGQ